ncbi:hypothetical protein [Vibrio penaeicida]|uniref:Phosphate ABC transporter substrate-binding protein n=1 Tax=Vibrio penaeicida TaxID=104609 RepID=A0AAV5NU90_9VIBR|nr:hypothetical protein [Vibrio penaeicida]RTZ24561.1 hypothetical protein EKN09_03065 [Vibrio penaeicida]GLQ73778.1 hypothetical protein GCM10007932_31380 [Vibrio penaeicida]
MRLITLILLLISPYSVADIYIVVGIQSDLEGVTKEQISGLYLGRNRGMKNRRLTILERSGDVREMFYEEISDLSLSQVNAHWAKLKFSGRVRAPLVMKTEEELIERLLKDKSALGYVRNKPTHSKLKVILTINDDE